MWIAKRRVEGGVKVCVDGIDGDRNGLVYVCTIRCMNDTRRLYTNTCLGRCVSPSPSRGVDHFDHPVKDTRMLGPSSHPTQSVHLAAVHPVFATGERQAAVVFCSLYHVPGVTQRQLSFSVKSAACVSLVSKNPHSPLQTSQQAGAPTKE